MNETKYRYILYIIIAVIVGTIGIQTYWNYLNYLNNKQQFINDMQVSLDTAVDTYYTNLAKETTLGFTFEDQDMKDGAMDSLMEQIDITTKNKINFDSLKLEKVEGINVFRGLRVDSLRRSMFIKNTKVTTKNLEELKFPEKDSTNSMDFQILTSKVVISITRDSLSLPEIDSLLQKELALKKLNVTYDIIFKGFDDKVSQSLKRIDKAILKTNSKSSLLPKGSSLSITYANETLEILKRSLTGILISSLLILAVISSLFYLLKIIKNQKQLAEVKNDLISNVTHEFKTPIATISVALESIKDFNVIDNKEKTKSYIDLSKIQLDKLNVMVEKLLETATMDSENLDLNKETIEVSEMLQTLVDKHQMQTQTKQIHFDNTTSVDGFVDVFHFENAINNVIDNAIKYGGNHITISLNNKPNGFEIVVSDDGKTLTKAHKDVIFEKFYRIPKGNTHDVKGFGIGLYYTKKIIEKHQGKIDLELNNGLTTFKIFIPNEHV
jgi:two-component system phosphate regulon sensor histidine kinase PhoR